MRGLCPAAERVVRCDGMAAEVYAMKMALTAFSVRYPWVVMAAVIGLTGILAAQFPKVHFDNDPENMLAEDEHVRLYHHEVKEKYALYDFVIAGIVNESHPDGVFNTVTLSRIHTLTAQLLSLRRGADGLPEVASPLADGTAAFRAVDLAPRGVWARALAVAFRHDANRLFGPDGASAIVAREIIGPSVVDNLRQAELGSLKLEYLMEQPPQTREEALRIRDDAMDNPLYNGTLVSEDEKAICLYLPLRDKSFSYNVAALVRALTADWDGGDKVYITGLPVAEDTFGVEMLVQMATSAPLAGLAIFVLLLLFFRRLSLIVAPMLVAVISVVCTMGLLIGRGYDVHIMSSMIAIFLMPIAVTDSVHILSEFFDAYHRFGNKRETLKHVIGHLFMPMLYTSLTTIAGFASLATTPIPPVQVFGLHVAFGVTLAWVLTVTFVPAYIMLFVPSRSLDRGGGAACETKPSTWLDRGLEWLGRFGYVRSKAILVATALIVVVSAIGIGRIRVNDNPVKWFTPDHAIRVADDVLNAHFGGTYTAYLTFSSPRPEALDCDAKATAIGDAVQARFGAALPAATARFMEALARMKQRYRSTTGGDLRQCFVDLANEARKIDEAALDSWNLLADAVNYLAPAGLTMAGLEAAIGGVAGVDDADRATLVKRLQPHAALQGEALLAKALSVCEEFTTISFRDFLFGIEAELTAPLFKRPEVLAYIKSLQEHMLAHPQVGKTTSAVDALQKAAYELSYVAPPSDAGPEERAGYEARNRQHRAIPDTAAAVGQVFTQLEGMKKKDSLFHLVTRDYQEANVWIQLKSGDNTHMQGVVEDVRRYIASNPPPVPLNSEWAGLTYINVVWQDKMVHGMVGSLLSSFVVVLVMMVVLFRSVWFGILAMVPLSVTIAFIYGLIGMVGKDYDMPVAVLSSLTLGLSVDFAIHFLERAREVVARKGSWQAACGAMFKEPAVAISRNAITISIGFLPLLLAPLVPYKTVGFFLASIMAVSWVATLFILPACLTVLQRILFKTERMAEDQACGTKTTETKGVQV